MLDKVEESKMEAGVRSPDHVQINPRSSFFPLVFSFSAVNRLWSFFASSQ